MIKKVYWKEVDLQVSSAIKTADKTDHCDPATDSNVFVLFGWQQLPAGRYIRPFFFAETFRSFVSQLY